MTSTDVLDLLEESTTPGHYQACTFIVDMVKWMGEVEFMEFWKQHKEAYGIKTYEEIAMEDAEYELERSRRMADKCLDRLIQLCG